MAMPAPLDWLASPRSNRAWCRHNGLSVYLRRTRRSFDGNVFDCIDIGNVEVTDERKQNKGRFRSLLHLLTSALPAQSYLYTENVLTPQFANYFIRTGWHRATAGFIDSTATPCFYKRVDEFRPQDFE